MKKAPVIALSAVAVVAAVILVPPMFIKSTVAQQVSDWQKRMDDLPGYSLIVKQDQDSWFSSHYEAELSYNIGLVNPDLASLIESDDGALTIPFQLTTSYGPLLFSDGLSIGAAKATLQIDEANVPEFIHWDRTEPFYQLDVVRGLTGNYTHKDHIVAFEAKPDEENGSLQFAGYDGHGSYRNNVLTHDAQVDEITLTDQESLVIEGLTQHVSIEASLADVFNGALYNYTMTSGIKQISAGDVFSATGIKMTAENQQDEKAELNNATISFNTDTLKQADLGTVTDIKLAVAMNNISSEFMRRYNDLVVGGFLEVDPEQQQAQLLELLTNNLALLLKPKPELNITEFSAQIDDGKFELDAHSHIDAGDNPDVEALVSGPDAWLPLIQADAALKVDKALLDAVVSIFVSAQLKPMLEYGQITQEEYDAAMAQAQQQMIDSFVAQGLLEQRDDGVYIANFLMEKGTMTLNGQPMNL